MVKDSASRGYERGSESYRSARPSYHPTIIDEIVRRTAGVPVSHVGHPRSMRVSSVDFEAFDRLASDLSDQFEVLVDLEHGEVDEFGGGGDQKVGDRRCPMLTALS